MRDFAAKLPKEGDEGLSDTAKQVSLLLGSYTLKFADFVREKDAEGGYSQKLLGSVKCPRRPVLCSKKYTPRGAG